MDRSPMVPTPGRFGVAFACILLGGCGGDGSAPTPQTSMSLSTYSVSLAPRVSDAAPQVTITVTATNPPSSQLFVGTSGSQNAVANLAFNSLSPTQGQVMVTFKSPALLGAGTYNDTLQIAMCYDNACAQHVSNSPQNVAIQFTVVPDPSVTFDDSPATVTALLDDAQAPTLTRLVPVHDAAPSDIHLEFTGGGPGIDSITVDADVGNNKQYTIHFKSPALLGVGTFANNISVAACESSACARIYPNTPKSLAIDYKVTLPELPTTGRFGLAHDVIDAEYSAALDAIVAVSSWPQNALYVIDPYDGTEKVMALGKAPSSVSLAPGGAMAAVGHDALISIVDLGTVGAGGSPTLLHPSADVDDVVFDGNGVVHAFSLTVADGKVRSIPVATDVEALGATLVYSIHPFLLPGTAHIYAPQQGGIIVEKFDTSSGVAQFVYFRGVTHCERLWPGAGGTRTYSGCGEVRIPSTTEASDLAYGGRFELPLSAFLTEVYGVSDSVSADEVVLIEGDSVHCEQAQFMAQCVTNILAFERDLLGSTGKFSLPSVAVSGVDHRLDARFVFHSDDGAFRFVIGKLYDQADPSKDYYLLKAPVD